MKTLDDIIVDIGIYGSECEAGARFSDRVKARKVIEDDIQALIDASAVKWVPVSKGASRFGETALLTVGSLGKKAVVIGDFTDGFGWDFDLSQLEDLDIEDETVLAWAEIPKPWGGES